MSTKIDLEDTLGEASSFVQAIHLAAAGLGDTKNTCALQTLAEQVAHRLEKARDLIDDLEETDR